jgi:hypothetical protein
MRVMENKGIWNRFVHNEQSTATNLEMPPQITNQISKISTCNCSGIGFTMMSPSLFLLIFFLSWAHLLSFVINPSLSSLQRTLMKPNTGTTTSLNDGSGIAQTLFLDRGCS